MRRLCCGGWCAALVLTAVCCAGRVAAAADGDARPNILLIMVDDMGWSDLGCYGGEIRTPNIDRLAAGGVRFTQFYNTGRCCPTRAALMTGLYAHQAGVGLMNRDAGEEFPGYRGFLSDRAVTIPEVLRAAGYQTLMVGKWHLTPQTNPIARGFEEFYGLIGGGSSFWREHPAYTRWPEDRPRRKYAEGEFYSTDAFADYAVDFLHEAHGDADRPWFLYLAFNAPHFPLHAPEEEIAKYEALYAKGWDEVRAARLARQKELGLLASDTELSPRSVIPLNDFNEGSGWVDKHNPAWDSLPADRRADLARRMAVFAGMVDRMDQAVGRVVDDVRQAGELDNTLILFLSDNGACAEWDPYGFDGRSGPNNVLHTGEDLKRVGGTDSYISYGSAWANASNTPWRLYKHYGHEGGIRAPLIAHWPKGFAAQGELRHDPGHVIDLLATCADAAEADYPRERDGKEVVPTEGRSLLSIFKGDKQPPRTLGWEHEGNRAFRQGNWKLVALAGEPWELYDLESDPLERNNLAEQESERAAAMARDWQAWAKRCQVLPQPVRERPSAAKQRRK